MTKKEARIILFSITICWASAYIFIKDVPDGFSAYAYLTLTSGVAGILLALGFHSRFRNLNRKTLWHGIILALLITGNILFEKFALDVLPASSVSAIASLNIVLVPMILIFRKQFPSRNNVAGIFIILVGLFVSGRFSMEGGGVGGMLYILISCVMMSFYTVLAADYTRESDPLLLTVLQLCITAVIGLVMWVATEPHSFWKLSWSAEAVSYILIIAFFSKAYAYVMLMYAEKYADAISVTVIAATEPVVTLTLAVLIPNIEGVKEIFTRQSLFGALIIAAGAIVAGTDFLSRKTTAKKEEGSRVPVPEEKPSAEDKTGKVSQKTRFHPYISSFLAITVSFALLGVSIDILEFAEGLSKARMENSIPMVAGIFFGPVGALACTLGNLISDIYSKLGRTLILGTIANFVAAYIPYRMWYAFSGKRLHVHSMKNLLLYIWSAGLSSLACSCVLTFGLEIFFSRWYNLLFQEIFINNFLFSMIFGLPIFIVLTTEKTGFRPYVPKALEAGPASGKQDHVIVRSVISVSATILFAACFILTLLGYRWQNSSVIRILAICSGIFIAALCFLPVRITESRRESGV